MQFTSSTLHAEAKLQPGKSSLHDLTGAGDFTFMLRQHFLPNTIGQQWPETEVTQEIISK